MQACVVTGQGGADQSLGGHTARIRPQTPTAWFLLIISMACWAADGAASLPVRLLLRLPDAPRWWSDGRLAHCPPAGAGEGAIAKFAGLGPRHDGGQNPRAGL